MFHPLKRVHITQKFGSNPSMYAQFGLNGHNGIDYRTRFDGKTADQEVHAAMDGTVINVTNEGSKGYGRYIRLQHVGTEQTIYAHLSRQDVKIGQKIKAGQVIGLTGNTGYSTGPHLHFGWRPNGWAKNEKNGYSGYVDPLPYLQPIGTPTQQPTQNNQSDTITMNDNFKKFLKDKTGVDFGDKLSEKEQDNVVRLLNEREQSIARKKEQEEMKIREELNYAKAIVSQKEDALAQKDAQLVKVLSEKQELNGRIIELQTKETSMTQEIELKRQSIVSLLEATEKQKLHIEDITKQNRELYEISIGKDEEIAMLTNKLNTRTTNSAIADGIANIVGENKPLVSVKDWKRAGWQLANIAMSVVTVSAGSWAILDAETINQLKEAITTQTVSVGLVAAVVTAVAQWVTKKLNTK